MGIKSLFRCSALGSNTATLSSPTCVFALLASLWLWWPRDWGRRLRCASCHVPFLVCLPTHWRVGDKRRLCVLFVSGQVCIGVYCWRSLASPPAWLWWVASQLTNSGVRVVVASVPPCGQRSRFCMREEFRWWIVDGIRLEFRRFPTKKPPPPETAIESEPSSTRVTQVSWRPCHAFRT